MELKAVEIAPYKKKYGWVLLICIASFVISFIIVKQGYTLLTNDVIARIIKYIFLLGVAVVATIFSSFQKKQKQKILTLSDLDEKLVIYQKLFRSRLWFYSFCCVGSAIIYYVTTSRIVFYFGLFDLFLMLFLFPNPLIFKKELNDEELIVH